MDQQTINDEVQNDTFDSENCEIFGEEERHKENGHLDLDPTDIELRQLHAILDVKNNEDSASDCSGDDSSDSVAVITTGAGTVSEIRELFSSIGHEEHDQHSIIKGMHSGEPSAQVAAEISQACSQKQSVCSNNPALVSLHVSSHHGNYHDQREPLNSDAIGGLGGTPIRKRKHGDQSDTSPNSDQTNGGDNDNDKLYPLFCKKPSELAQKDEKSTPKTQRSKKKKKCKKEDQTLNTDINTDPTLEEILQSAEQNLQVLDVREVVGIYHKLKQHISSLERQQKVCIKEIKEDFHKEMESKLEKAKKAFKLTMEKDIQSAVSHYQKRIDDLEADLTDQKTRVELMSQIIKQNHDIVQDITKRLDAIDINLARKSAEC